MTTINDKEFIFKLILDNGKYPGDEDVWTIWQYHSPVDPLDTPEQPRSPWDEFQYPRYMREGDGESNNFKIIRDVHQLAAWFAFGEYSWTRMVFPSVYPEMDDCLAAQMHQRKTGMKEICKRLRNFPISGDTTREFMNTRIPQPRWNRIFI